MLGNPYFCIQNSADPPDHRAVNRSGPQITSLHFSQYDFNTDSCNHNSTELSAGENSAMLADPSEVSELSQSNAGFRDSESELEFSTMRFLGPKSA